MNKCFLCYGLCDATPESYTWFLITRLTFIFSFITETNDDEIFHSGEWMHAISKRVAGCLLVVQVQMAPTCLFSCA